jgi:hypothetical protein
LVQPIGTDEIVEERLAICTFLNNHKIKKLDDYYILLTNGNCIKGNGSLINNSYGSFTNNLRSISKEKISETFFFYGLKSTLYELSKFIVENKE